ncbi:prepilin peptidase [Candidatus Pacearchaeota archaeon]|nr:prepilin peptidase [Candidatus Pacearchaeota archaeon]
MILTQENLFLIIIAVVWILGAVFQDLRRREVDNIWNFSLIGIALTYRLAVSINGSYWFFINGILGLVVFLILGNLFYYSRIFAGGDAKLLIALGSIMPLSYNWIINLKLFGSFIALFLFGGAAYVFLFSFILIAYNWNRFIKEFRKQFIIYRSFFVISLLFLVLWVFVSYFINNIIYLGVVFLLFPLLFIFAKSIEESCLVKALSPSELTEGEWLYEDIFVNGKKIKATWEGVSKNDLRLIKEKYRRKIWVKQGIPFTPGFLIGFLGIIIISMKLGWF